MKEKILSIKKYVYFILFLVIGITFFFFPIFQSGFDTMPGSGYSVKFFNYILEHSWLWVQQIAPHKYFWDAPFYYPNANTLAYSDTLMAIMPFYWLLRTMFSSFGSMQLLLILMSVLNYGTFYYLLKKQINFSDLASSVGAFVFAFNILRSYRMDDVVYFTQFFTILAIIFLLKVNTKNTPVQNHKWFILFALSMLAQFYSCFALGFFAVFIAAWVFIFGLLPKTSRDALLGFLVHHYKLFLFYCGVIISLLAPLSYHFTSLNYVKPLAELLMQIPEKIVWFRNVSILDSLFFKKVDYIGLFGCDEVSLSLGLLTMLLAIFGLFKLKYAKGLPILILVFIFFASCGFSAINMWKVFYYITLGSEGLLIINRIAFIALIVVALGVASLVYFFEKEIVKNKVITNILLIFTILLVAIEQIPFQKDINSAWKNFSWSKKEFRNEINKIAKDMPKDCEVFNLTYMPFNAEKYSQVDFDIRSSKMYLQENLLGMWVAIEKRRKTYNGYSVLYPQRKSDAQNPKSCNYGDNFDLDKI